jgi:uncharacterized protein YraI
MNTWKCSMLSVGFLALSGGWAAAAPAVVLDFLNLRIGPGYDYAIIEVIPAGWTVDTGNCVAGWCQVYVDGIPGYVDANYLGVARAPVVGFGVSPYYWPYGSYERRYADWAYPYRDFYGVRYGSSLAYYDAPYDGGPYLGALPDAYAQARNADIAVNRKPADRAKRTAVAKRSTTVAHVAKLPSGPSTTGAAPTNAGPRSGADQNPRY